MSQTVSFMLEKFSGPVELRIHPVDENVFGKIYCAVHIDPCLDRD